jgi:hypothetical protein
MEVKGQLHAPTALPTGKELPVPIGYLIWKGLLQKFFCFPFGCSQYKDV